MATKVGINGFGRIGRAVTRIITERGGDLEVAAVNDLSDAKSLAHLFKYDTVMGKWSGTVEVGDGELVINNKAVKVLSVKNPAELPWKDMGVKVVLESTGIFRTKESAKGGYGAQLTAGHSKNVLSVSAKDVC
jgi:glyceraldehyde 3-phosphate dehydrogenase